MAVVRSALLKRAMDVGLSAIALVVLSPVLLAVAVAIRLKLGRPVLFCQLRPGLMAEPFLMIKFRTMRNAVDANGRPLSDEERLTSFGRALRAFSLDELPELWNVLRGEMSLVGPRPLLMQYLPLYSPQQARRHDVRPGLTGLAQVSGRNAISWEQKFALDLEYVDHHNMWLDLKILARTVAKVLCRDSISADGHATMPAFTGVPASPVRPSRPPAAEAKEIL
jgi:lipopolysaccharide/colanic/teichoic acid biosynthesis glycosyltransferase